ncbi:preprotein translocase subunit SecG [Oceanithermus sp.]
MGFLYSLIVFIYLLVAAALVWVVLLQEPKQGGGDLLGGGATDLFAARGVTGGMYRITIWLGVAFAALSIIIDKIAR